MNRVIEVIVLTSFLIVTSVLMCQEREEYWKFEKYRLAVEGIKNLGYTESEIDSLFSSPEVKFYLNIIKVFDYEKRSDDSPTDNIYLKFLKEESVNMGRKFLENNRKLLKVVEKETGIEKEYIVALFRIESAFGENIGKKYNAFSSLNSIIYYGEEGSIRVKRSQEWLVKLIILYEEELKGLGMSIFNIPSSRAGCMGIPQFSPEIYIKYAMDADGDGRRDLFHSIEDATWSSAYYLVDLGFKENKRRALLRWNNSGDFADFILDYAEKLKINLYK